MGLISLRQPESETARASSCAGIGSFKRFPTPSYAAAIEFHLIFEGLLHRPTLFQGPRYKVESQISARRPQGPCDAVR